MDGLIFVGTNFRWLNKNNTFVGFNIRGQRIFLHNSYRKSLIRWYWNSWIRPSTNTTKIGTRWGWVYWCITSHATIFQSYMWRHRCAGGLKKLYLRSGSHHNRHFAGFFNAPVLQWHGNNLFIRWFRHTAQFSRLLRHAGHAEGVKLVTHEN